jgi:transposase InsO family protein
VLRRAVAWFTARGITIERVLSDNGSCYRSRLWAATCAELGIRPKKSRPYRPETNGKIERFYRTLAAGWAFPRMFPTETVHRRASSVDGLAPGFPGWCGSIDTCPSVGARMTSPE